MTNSNLTLGQMYSSLPQRLDRAYSEGRNRDRGSEIGNNGNDRFRARLPSNLPKKRPRSKRPPSSRVNPRNLGGPQSRLESIDMI